MKDNYDAIDDVKFRDWTFLVFEDCLQVEFMAPDPETGKPALQRSRKWMLSRHMTRGEVVQTAFKAVLTALEHEAREDFTYKGEVIFGPHLDVEALVGFCQQNKPLMRAVHERQQQN